MTKRSRTGEETVQFSVRLPVSLKEEIDKSVVEQDLDVTTWVRHACRDKLNREKASNVSNASNASDVYAMLERLINQHQQQTSTQQHTEKVMINR